jgi:hypothetical protein
MKKNLKARVNYKHPLSRPHSNAIASSSNKLTASLFGLPISLLRSEGWLFLPPLRSVFPSGCRLVNAASHAYGTGDTSFAHGRVAPQARTEGGCAFRSW